MQIKEYVINRDESDDDHEKGNLESLIYMIDLRRALIFTPDASMSSPSNSQRVQVAIDLINAITTTNYKKASALLSEDFKYILLPKSLDGKSKCKEEMLVQMGELLQIFVPNSVKVCMRSSRTRVPIIPLKMTVEESVESPGTVALHVRLH